jgi:alpha-beta hydrolase superfamily lysophospholipase
MLPPTFDSFDGTTICCWSVMPSSGRATAKILLVHGLGTHSKCLHFRYLRDALSGMGFAAYGFDLRGYGKSGGRRAFVNEWRDFREDLLLLVEMVERDGESVPLFLLGVSLGGLIAVNYAIHYPAGIQGVITIAAALDASGVPAWLRKLSAMLAKIAPRLRLTPGLDETRLTRDRDAQREFNSDPLRQRKMTVRLAAETTAAMAETLERLPLLRVPLLVMHGSADVIVPPAAGQLLYRLAGSTDKEHNVYEGACHILSMEINREQVLGDIGTWIIKRVSIGARVASTRSDLEGTIQNSQLVKDLDLMMLEKCR